VEEEKKANSASAEAPRVEEKKTDTDTKPVVEKKEERKPTHDGTPGHVRRGWSAWG
jgi:hypothetical protein